MQYKVPFVDPRDHYRRIKEEVDFAFTDTLSRGDLVLRQQLKTFEQNLAHFIGVKYVVGVNSGYHALHFAMLAAKVGPGDEVITVAHTFAATISAIVHAGATPVLVDVRDDYNMDPKALAAAVTPRTKAIIPVHLNGRICDMDPIQEVAGRHNLSIIEDAAQALGATYRGHTAGSFGLAGCFSFYPFKTLGGIGDGGAVSTNDPDVARLATLLRFNGEDRETGEFFCHGYTALLGNVNAAILDVKLRHLPDWIKHRREIAALYTDRLSEIDELSIPDFPGDEYFDTFQNYVIRTARRDELRDHLRQEGIETLVHWAKPIWAYPGLGLSDPGLPMTDRICDEVISLPMSAETTPEQVEITTSSICRFFASSPLPVSTAAR